ncbi:hypothetical protein SETIT_8G087900v2 [Setaria italica]|uniref:Uncharacterized protein n=3 Tax=Setaria TaxID=4554 RepID=K3ZKP2_SETIT|nr:hypothetical protein SETIT_8G087900v2 [Setaria italica]TKW00133.1 hypothetical protein SEVIR_8G089000v2 [Setaria viridis]
MADADSNVPGGYFMGRPSNAPEQQPAESKPANTQTPGDYFIGTPEHGRTAAGSGKPTGDQKKSKSFLECLPCLGGGQVAN